MKRYGWIVAAIVVGVAAGILLSRRSHRLAAPYELRVLPGFPGGHITAAFDINDAGDIVGRAELPRGVGHGRAHAVLWRHGVLVDLGALPRGGSEADRVAADGAAVGWSSVYGQAIHAVQFTGGGLADLGVHGGFAARAVAVNDFGNIVLSVDNLDGSSSGFVQRGSRWISLGTLPGRPDTLPSDIGPSGVVVGAGRSDAKATGFIWRDGLMSALRAPAGYADCNAHRINASGSIAGCASNGASDFHAVLWTDGMPKILPTNGASDSGALGLNERGLVVGVSNDHAVVWKAGRLLDLNNVTDLHLDATLTAAVAVNNRGEIVCDGVIADIPHAFLLIPRR